MSSCSFLDKYGLATIYRSHEKLPGPTATSALSGKVDVCADRRRAVNRAIPRPSRDRQTRPRNVRILFTFDTAFGFAASLVIRDK